MNNIETQTIEPIAGRIVNERTLNLDSEIIDAEVIETEEPQPAEQPHPHFIESNTAAITMDELSRTCIVPTFSDNSLTKALPILQDESTRDLFRFLNGCIESAKRDKGIDLTFVLVAHANKEGYGVSICTEHLKGTSKVADYADLVLAIGPTRFGKSTKMLKVLNNRNEPEPDKVLVMKRVDSAPLLHFEPVREMREEDAGG